MLKRRCRAILAALITKIFFFTLNSIIIYILVISIILGSILKVSLLLIKITKPPLSLPLVLSVVFLLHL